MMMNDYQGVSKDLNETNVLEPNNPFTLQLWKIAKCKLIDYEGALSDLDKANGLQPNDAFILKTCSDLKNMLNDHEGASKDLKKKNYKVNKCIHFKWSDVTRTILKLYELYKKVL
jgi:tetratricopeptide (TPR) repeat protein